MQDTASQRIIVLRFKKDNHCQANVHIQQVLGQDFINTGFVERSLQAGCQQAQTAAGPALVNDQMPVLALHLEANRLARLIEDFIDQKER